MCLHVHVNQVFTELPWCLLVEYQPSKLEIAGSNPVQGNSVFYLDYFECLSYLPFVLSLHVALTDLCSAAGIEKPAIEEP